MSDAAERDRKILAELLNSGNRNHCENKRFAALANVIKILGPFDHKERTRIMTAAKILIGEG